MPNNPKVGVTLKSCRTNLGLQEPRIRDFMEKTRFINLGTFCALSKERDVGHPCCCCAGPSVLVMQFERTKGGNMILKLPGNYHAPMDKQSTTSTAKSSRYECNLEVEHHHDCNSPEHVFCLLHFESFPIQTAFPGGVAQALQSLGLRGAAGPFDWIRSRCEGATWRRRRGSRLVQ